MSIVKLAVEGVPSNSNVEIKRNSWFGRNGRIANFSGILDRKGTLNGAIGMTDKNRAGKYRAEIV